MIRVCEVENRVTEHDHRLFVGIGEYAGEWIIPHLDNFKLSDPLPKLSLCRPEFLVVAADDLCRSFILSSALGGSLIFHCFMRANSSRQSARIPRISSLGIQIPQGEASI